VNSSKLGNLLCGVRSHNAYTLYIFQLICQEDREIIACQEGMPRLPPGLERTCNLRKHPKVTSQTVLRTSDESSTPAEQPVSRDYVGRRSEAARHQLTLGEIEARVDVLFQQLLPERHDYFRRKVKEARNGLSTEVFRLNHEKILGDARRAADLDCLRRFFRGLCEVFEDSLTPSGAQLGAQDLWDIWRDRIEPRWKRCVQMFKAGLRRLYHDKPSKYVAGLVVALENDAAHIHDRELAMWRLKIQEAVRHERFVQGKVVPDASKTMEIAATGKQGATIGEKLANPSQYPTMNLKETRQALGNVSRSTIYRWADEGKLQRAHLGRQSGKRSRVLIRTESVREMLKESSE
jgi:hypothetical protein